MSELSAEVVAFLSEGTRTGKLGFVASDGRPLVAPIWYLVENGEIMFTTGKSSAKGRALARDPRVVLCVDLEAPPYGFVQIQGEATTSEEPDVLLDAATRLAARYVGPDRAEEFGRRNGVPGELIVRVRPTRVIAAFDMTN